MSGPRRDSTTTRRARLRALFAGLVLLGAVGSCELPKPHIPSLGVAPAAPTACSPTCGAPAPAVGAS